ncbi:MAG: DUF421 domain-containing protein [Acidimicrobiia bacterium]
MEPVTPFDWERLFFGVQPSLYVLELLFRVIVIYLFAVFVLRYMGKRGRRQMTPFEFVLIIALGSATGDSMLYPEVPILYAWLIILAIVGLDRILTFLQSRSMAAFTFLEGRPRLLVQEGHIVDESLDAEDIRREELMALLREQQVGDTGELRYAFLETTGSLGLMKRPNTETTNVESTFPPDV